MKIPILILLLALTSTFGFAQKTKLDSLKHQLSNERQDTNRVAIMLKLKQAFEDNYNPDSAKAIAEKALDLATKIHYPNGEFEALVILASHHRLIGDSPKALFYAFKGLRLAEAMRDHSKKGRILFQLARIYYLSLNDYQKAISYCKQTIQEYEALHDIENIAAAEASLSTIYRRTNQIDSMLIYQQRAYTKYESLKKIDSDGRFLMQLAYIAIDNYPLALSLFQKARIVNHSQKMSYNESYCLEGIASIYKKMNRLDSAIYYDKKVIELATPFDYKEFLVIAYKDLGDIYKLQNKDSAYYYLKKAWDINESVNGTQKIIALENTIAEEQERQQKEDIEKIDRENRLKQYALLAGLGMMFLIGFMLYRNNRQKRKANEVLENTLTDLKISQSELEIKNRDLEIEGALERVRSRAMAMQNSNELIEIANAMREQMGLLGQPELETTAVHLYTEGADSFDSWYAFRDGNQATGKVSTGTTRFKIDSCELTREMLASYYSDIKDYTLEASGLKLQEFAKILMEAIPAIKASPSKAYYHFSDFSGGSLTMVSYQPPSEESKYLIKKCASVFDLAYRRYLDLKLAEEQAREAQIELALERVRSRTMAMHKSEELGETVKLMLNELSSLEMGVISSWISFINVQDNTLNMWVTHDVNKPLISKNFKGEDNESFQEDIDVWKKKMPYLKKSIPADIAIPLLKNLFDVNLKKITGLETDYHLLQVPHKYGFIGSGTWEEANVENIQILQRIAAVFNQTYTRFLDLKNAEAFAEQAHLDLIQIQTEKKRAEDALVALKQTQTQLIQSEKLASLGELTAGIAHEIQNPLNFVNNFSELSVELIEEVPKPPEGANENWIPQEAPFGGWEAFFADLTQNLQKINHHGKRASSIVSGMLEHSRTSTGERAMTDINKLADEYLRLSYHGLRAKDSSFNADYEFIADDNLPKINVVPQDMGRVLLNLINNAFWAVASATSLSHQSHRSNYSPKVTVSTRWLSVAEAKSEVEIRITDNGTGMTEEVKAKIFQPFFTTKPTGQGTGLGLSLAYDIVTKGHGGTIECESTEGEGTTFIVRLPIQA